MQFTKATRNETLHTSFKGYVPTDYNYLVECFGEPDYWVDPKCIVSWALKFSDGTVATIYAWKLDYIPWDMHDWNIGGHSYEAVDRVLEILAGETAI